MEDIFLVLLLNVKTVQSSGILYFSCCCDQQAPLKLLQQLHLLHQLLLQVHSEPHHSDLIYYGLLFITNVFIIIMVIS